MIVCENLKITFNKGTVMETRALSGLNLTVPKGQFVCVIGSNGSGKSTMQNAIAGELPLDEGRILVDDVDITTWPAPKRTGLVARVFQDPLAGSCENLTIQENMSLAWSRGRKRGLGRAVTKETHALFRDKLSRLGLGLENRLEDLMGLLSGGQRQAVSLLMASLQPSSVLMLDEHTSALDPRIAAFVMDLTRDIVQENNLTAIMVTHSMRQALDYGDRTVMLHGGRVVLDVAGEDRKGLDVPDLIRMFEKAHGEELSDDSLLLS
ncbi:ABC transporter ATP-binding protein [Sneathiella chinensis]|uniref:ABC transporter ATP-binding protein n=1 Tax=Sneathiella chinensis TaxID=349750 RepID=A0ABQ5U7S5_9PROT|nr:ABC transporter ATP-binding protein [Sneathiella chinensis]GLQ07723.1 ABC transporter ATP-binding protein [Sneathiella chinensis]